VVLVRVGAVLDDVPRRAPSCPTSRSGPRGANQAPWSCVPARV
jgi:hypothetical protein